MKRRFAFSIKDIITSIESITKFTMNMNYENFANDDKTSSAVIRKIEIIGEATKNIPSSITDKYTSIPWSDMAKIRDKVIHSYFGIDYLTIWNVSKIRFPEMKPELERILVEVSKEDMQEDLFNE
ncbi:MAG: DUF86 domain-containing protein [bacterium]